MYCNDIIPSFIGNLWRPLLLGNYLKGSKSAEGGKNPLADMDPGGPNPLADMDRGVNIR